MLPPVLCPSKSCSPCFFVADQQEYIEEGYPEKHGPFWWAQITEKVVSENKAVRFDKLKLQLNHVVDIRDLPLITATLVLNGEAILVEMPAVPAFLLKEYEAFLEMDTTPCSKTVEQHKVMANKILKDPDRKMHSVLFVLPEGMACSLDFSSVESVPPVVDKEVIVLMRKWKAVSDQGKSGTFSQLIYPGYWELRILDVAPDALTIEEKEERSFLDYFTGMKMDGDAGMKEE